MHKIHALVPLFLLSSFMIPIPSTADWSDDFSNDNLNGWEVWGENLIGDKTVEIDHSWEVRDGALTSTGELSPHYHNQACREINITEGSWSFDHYWPDLGFTESNAMITRLSLGSKYDLRGLNINDVTTFRGFHLVLARGHPAVKLDYVHLNVLHFAEFAIDSENYFTEITGEHGWHNYRFERDENVTVYLDDVEIMNLPGYHNEIPIIEYLCFSSIRGSYVQIDNVTASANPSLKDPSQNDSDLPLELLFAGVLVAVGVTSSVLGYHIHSKRKRGGKFKRFNEFLKEVLDQQKMKDQSLLSPILLAIDEGKSVGELDTHNFISALKKYKPLMHPIRLSILKIIEQEFQLTSVEIKNSLGLTWTEYSNHSKSLEELGMVQTQSQLTGDGVKQTISLTHLGRESFIDLKELLIELLEEVDLGFILKRDDKLYPSS